MAQVREVYKSWTELKSFLSAPKNLELQYHEYDYHYKCFALEATVEYYTEIWKDTSQVKGIDVTQNNLDKTDFEDNYKVDANQAIEMDVTVENDITVGEFGSGATTNITGDVTIEEGQMLLYTLPDNSGEPLKGPASLVEKSGDYFELAVKDLDVETKLELIKDEVEAVLSKLEDIEIRYGRIYDSDDDLYRLTVDSKTEIYGESCESGGDRGPVHVCEDDDGLRRLAVDANIHFEDDAIVNMDNITRRIWDGLVFEYSDSFIKRNGQTKEYLIKVDSNYQLHIFWNLVSELGISFEVYEGTTVSSDGTQISSINCNRNSTNTASSLIYEDPTVTVDGTKIRNSLQLGSNQTGTMGQSSEVVLKANTNYLLRITSKGNGNEIGYQHVFYERELT